MKRVLIFSLVIAMFVFSSFSALAVSDISRFGNEFCQSTLTKSGSTFYGSTEASNHAGYEIRVMIGYQGKRANGSSASGETPQYLSWGNSVSGSITAPSGVILTYGGSRHNAEKYGYSCFLPYTL